MMQPTDGLDSYTCTSERKRSALSPSQIPVASLAKENLYASIHN